jgi:hypothetical protein
MDYYVITLKCIMLLHYGSIVVLQVYELDKRWWLVDSDGVNLISSAYY